MAKKFVDTMIEGIAERDEITIEHATQKYLKNSDFVLNFDDMPSAKHSWTDRGLKWTCENAQHPYHEVWKQRKAAI